MPQNAIPKVVTSVTGQRDRHPLTISDLQIPMGIPVMAVMGAPTNPGLTGWHPRWTNGGWVQLKKMLYSQRHADLQRFRWGGCHSQIFISLMPL